MDLSFSETLAPSLKTRSKYFFHLHLRAVTKILCFSYSSAKPKTTLNLDNTFSSFCPPEREREVKNTRLAVLDNFKEISRIMTQNFITHKKL